MPKDIPLYAPSAIASWLVNRGYSHAVPLDPGDRVALCSGALRVHAGRATHKGSRYGFDRWRSAANMYLLESDDESAFFAGDTALTPETHHLVERVLWKSGRELDIAMLPIGHAPAWKRRAFRRGHLTSEDALALFERLRAHVLVPYHWGTFRHITAGAYDAINVLRKHLETYAGREQVHVVEPGEALIVDGLSISN